MQMRLSHEIRNPTYYIQALHGEYAPWAYAEQKAVGMKGRWREQAFDISGGGEMPLDLEIGTGNGFFFAHRAALNRDRLIVGIEIKFKPLIQSIRRALASDCQNARIVRYHAAWVEELFAPSELNDIFIHHPDPWEHPRKQKHRLFRREYLNKLFNLQRPGAHLEFKTDSESYFRWAKNETEKTSYRLERYAENLHASEWGSENFVTHFESIFTKKGLPIYYMRLER